MKTGTDLSHLYSLRRNFTVIAMTGRTGSGCTQIANQISQGFIESEYPKPNDPKFDLNNHSYKKYQIIYKFAKENFGPYTLINYRDIVSLFIFERPIEEFFKFLNTDQVNAAFNRIQRIFSDQVKEKHYVDLRKERPDGEKEKLDFILNEINICDFSKEIIQIKKKQRDFQSIQKKIKKINFEKIKQKDKAQAKSLYNLFFSLEFKSLSSDFHTVLKSISPAKHNIVFQLITNNIRRSGNPYKSKDIDASNIFQISDRINTLIKAIRNVNGTGETKVVIDSLRNPFEVMYFKQRFSAFYLMAVNRDPVQADKYLEDTYGKHFPVIKRLLDEEYIGGKGREFFKQFVRSCIEKADIHISYRTREETDDLNKNYRIDNTTPYFSWEMQLLKYISLIEKPGIVTPSSEERCMQMAYTAKCNSGCISRQVGAAITDEYYSIKAIGWNNTPEGQTPCLLRNIEPLLNSSPVQLKRQLKLEDELIKKLKIKEYNLSKGDYKGINYDLYSFTNFEKSDKVFISALKSNYESQIQNNKELLKGRNVCMCFKSLHNSCYDGKNQVHTRSLHAEESAFLQITKYGGTAIKNGKLFTTASPCELCAKKAYQLGIRVIYYVDPYPGISQKQILDTGKNPPQVRLFNGAIGNAYHWLYEPFMAYKDELSLLLGQNIKDKLSILQEEAEIKEMQYLNTIKNLESKIEKLEKKNRK